MISFLSEWECEVEYYEQNVHIGIVISSKKLFQNNVLL